MLIDEEKEIEDMLRRKCSSERGLLVASGLKTEAQIYQYRLKLDKIESWFDTWKSWSSHAVSDEAENLFNFFWSTHPDRYTKYNVLLPRIIDTELSGWKKRVGNCVGLSSLYGVVGLRKDLEIKTLIGPRHVMVVLKEGNKSIPIETTIASGFNFESDLTNFREKDFLCLGAQFYQYRSQKKCSQGDLDGAMIDVSYGKKLDSEFPPLYSEEGKIRFMLNDLDEAILKFNKSIELFSGAYEPYLGIALCKVEQNRLEESLKYFDRAIELNGKEWFLYYTRAITKKGLGDVGGAENDMAIAISIKKGI